MTRTLSGTVNVRPTMPLCAAPASTSIAVGLPPFAFAWKSALIAVPTPARAACVPATVPSVHCAALTPFASLVALRAVIFPPPDTTDHATGELGEMFPYASYVVAVRFTGSIWPTTPSC